MKSSAHLPSSPPGPCPPPGWQAKNPEYDIVGSLAEQIHYASFYLDDDTTSIPTPLATGQSQSHINPLAPTPSYRTDLLEERSVHGGIQPRLANSPAHDVAEGNRKDVLQEDVAPGYRLRGAAPQPKRKKEHVGNLGPTSKPQNAVGIGTNREGGHTEAFCSEGSGMAHVLAPVASWSHHPHSLAHVVWTDRTRVGTQEEGTYNDHPRITPEARTSE